MVRILLSRRPKSQAILLVICTLLTLRLIIKTLTSPTPFMVIFILSREDNRPSRDAIRATWMKDAPSDVTGIFVIGLKSQPPEVIDQLKAESKEFGDLLLLPQQSDTYGTLTSKLMGALQFAISNMDFRFFMKVDDDSFVRVDALRREAKRIEGRGVYWGFFDGRAPVVKTGGPWIESDWIMCDTYVPYAKGGGYLLSHDLVKFITDNSHMMTQYNSEDVSVGAWLVPLEVKRLHDFRFNTEYRSRGCSNRYLVTHKVNAHQMYTLHQNIHRLGRLCKQEVTLWHSYIYNWHVPPSECCHRNLTDYGDIQNDW
ncbi:hypothetical protein CAPTEDRAFT_118776 [Capitella teleta]|uniref:Hexosyltransferase n=1 Tax=Capitella teleta TaxID=283909 RepID=R7T5U9_CAPTE|nr:hypothetical protein CAPTEDRAFT_118776 [Capitella teleta]|eukprot:ELT88690.1 hypothetical protein CAPTEDRAFT_118776 [Capitella teleta]